MTSYPEPDPSDFDAIGRIDQAEKKLLAAMNRVGNDMAGSIRAMADSPEQEQTRALLTELNGRLTQFDRVAVALADLRRDAAKGRAEKRRSWPLLLAIGIVGAGIGAGALFGVATRISLPGLKAAQDPVAVPALKIWKDNLATMPACQAQATRIKTPVQCPVIVQP